MSEKNTIDPLRRFFLLLEPDKGDIKFIYIFAVFNGLIALSLPLAIQGIMGLLAAGRTSTSWYVLLFLLFFGIFFSGILNIIQFYISENLQRNIFTRTAFEFSFRIPRLETQKINKTFAPELVNRFFDTIAIQKGLPKILIDFSTATFQIVIGILVLSLYSPVFIVFGILVAALLSGLWIFTARKGLETSIYESKYKYKVVYWLEELARTMLSFKLAGQSDLPLRRTDENVGGYLQYRKKHFVILMRQYLIFILFKSFVTVGLLGLGSYLVINNSLNLGQFVASEIIIILVMNSVEKLILCIETIYDVLTAVDKIGSVVDLQLENEQGIVKISDTIPTQKGLSIELESVSFSYADDPDTIVLDDLRLRIEGGERICIVGHSNSGKSTLLQLIGGIHKPQKGSISYNEIPAKNLYINDLRTYIADFSEREDLFDGTLLENINMGKRDVSPTDVITVLNEVGLGNWFRKLENGLLTMILPEGQTLSKSICQKLILARALSQPAQLFIMETPLDNLLPDDRQRIIEKLTNPEMPWTLIIISNLVSVMQTCNRILVLEKGKIVADGNYESVKSWL